MSIASKVRQIVAQAQQPAINAETSAASLPSSPKDPKTSQLETALKVLGQKGFMGEDITDANREEMLAILESSFCHTGSCPPGTRQFFKTEAVPVLIEAAYRQGEEKREQVEAYYTSACDLMDGVISFFKSPQEVLDFLNENPLISGLIAWAD